MPSPLISSVFGKTSFTVVNELTRNECWRSIKIKDVEVDSSSLNTSNPVDAEDAANQSTFISLLSSDINTLKIIQPARMRISSFCTDLSSIESIISVFKDTQATLTVTTKGIKANKMAVVSVDIEQSPEMTSAAKVIIELEQTAPQPAANTFDPSQSSDESSYGISIQSPPKLSLTATSLYAKISNFIGG